MRPLFSLSQALFDLRKTKYNPIQQDATEKESFLTDPNAAGQSSEPKSAACRNLYLLSSVVLQSIIISVLFIYIILNREPNDLACAKQLSPYSPYLESGDLEYQEFNDQNHLMQPSIYRGQPTLEVEQAWIDLWKLPTIRFPESKLEALNKTPASLYTHVAPEFGDGVKGFLDVFHQLHCLSTVRQYTYREEYDYSNVTAFRAPDEVVRGHIDHCIETIRKAIMCSSDVTPITFAVRGGKPDFNIRRKCRNYQRIQEWAIQNIGSDILETD